MKAMKAMRARKAKKARVMSDTSIKGACISLIGGLVLFQVAYWLDSPLSSTALSFFRFILVTLLYLIGGSGILMGVTCFVIAFCAPDRWRRVEEEKGRIERRDRYKKDY